MFVNNNQNKCLPWKFSFSTIVKINLKYYKLAGPPGAARDYFTISLWKSPLQIDLRTLRASGWGEPQKNKNFKCKPTPRSNFCLLAPPNSQSIHPHLAGWTLRAPGLGEPPTNKILHGKPTPRSNFCLLAPHPILHPSGFFRRSHYRGYPQGSTFGVAPWLGAEPGWNEEPMPNFRVIGCVGPAACRRTYTHTHTHTFTFIY